MDIEFSRLFKKVTRRQFLDEHFDKRHYVEKGAFEDVDMLFSWAALNDLFNRSALWEEGTIELALDGQVIPAGQYCRSGVGRQGGKVMRPDQNRVNHFLRQGATLVLDFLHGIDPAIQDVALCLERLTGAPTSCNAYCSWKEVRGYESHFDVMDVFAIQIEGEKLWNIYSGRAPNPAFMPGVSPADFSVEQHRQMRGEIVEQVLMKPGDVLYIPRGLYHDALAREGDSLHLSFGATHDMGATAFTMLARDIQPEDAFRRALPHLDDPAGLAAYLTELGQIVAARMADPKFHTAVRQMQMQNLHDKVFRHRLPRRDADQFFMVHRRPPKVVRRGPNWALELGSEKVDLPEAAAPIAKYVLEQEFVWATDLMEAFPTAGPMLGTVLSDFEARGILIRFHA